MKYHIKSIEFYVRETKPGRFAVALGSAGQPGQAGEPSTNPLCHVRMILHDSSGHETFGCAADRLSVRWLDKRPERSEGLKLRELVALIRDAGEQYLARDDFYLPFDQWHACYGSILATGRKKGQEDLTSAFASALLERAMLDGVCRLAGKPLFEMLRDDRLGFRPEKIHSELAHVAPRRLLARILPARPRTRISIRHTVGPFDPLTDADYSADRRLNDGLPETLEEYIARDGIRYFKVKVTGDIDRDVDRLARLWDILPHELAPGVTLDANEAFEDVRAIARFVERLERDLLGLFQHILYIEQPLPRQIALQDEIRTTLRRIGRIKPVILDESDDALDTFKRALALGYAGTSHKNCKGFFKSLMHRALIVHFADHGRELLLSGEDLQNLPIVPLHQDFVSVGILDLEHCERNGHHFNYGLSMLSKREKEFVEKHHHDLYERRGDEWFLRIRDGMVDCSSLHCAGFGVRDEPDWGSMAPMDQWIRDRHPA